MEGRREDRARLIKVLSDLSISQLGTLPTSAIDSQPQGRAGPNTPVPAVQQVPAGILTSFTLAGYHLCLSISIPSVASTKPPKCLHRV